MKYAKMVKKQSIQFIKFNNLNCTKLKISKSNETVKSNKMINIKPITLALLFLSVSKIIVKTNIIENETDGNTYCKSQSCEAEIRSEKYKIRAIEIICKNIFLKTDCLDIMVCAISTHTYKMPKPTSQNHWMLKFTR